MHGNLFRAAPLINERTSVHPQCATKADVLVSTSFPPTNDIKTAISFFTYTSCLADLPYVKLYSLFL